MHERLFTQKSSLSFWGPFFIFSKITFLVVYYNLLQCISQTEVGRYYGFNLVPPPLLPSQRPATLSQVPILGFREGSANMVGIPHSDSDTALKVVGHQYPSAKSGGSPISFRKKWWVTNILPRKVTD